MIRAIRSLIGRSANQLVMRFGYHIVKLESPASPDATAPLPGQSLLRIDLDYVIQHYLARTKPAVNAAVAEFFVIQVGAYDGRTNDPLYQYIQKYRWRGILIEPQQEPFAFLQQTYKDHTQLTLLNVAIAEQNGQKDFYQLRAETSEDGSNDLPVWGQQIASLSLPNVLKHKHGVPDYGISTGIPNIEDLIEVHKVDCLSFQSLIERYNVENIDLLQVDAEGYDYELIMSFPFDRLKPSIVHYEHMHLSDEKQHACLRRLVALGYKVALEFSDTIAYLDQ
jgi:FkbM family methyltransferase